VGRAALDRFPKGTDSEGEAPRIEERDVNGTHSCFGSSHVI
jgi:hypothetical protein